MKTGRYNLKEILTHNEIEKIVIPEIQRDYVWKKNNVEKLLNSIYDAYKSKKTNQISIIDNNRPISSHIVEHLKLEYERLCSNHKIGFIYAYHDHQYAGKFFLIDGQQRITTLYLLLLVLYKKTELTNDFKELYFQDEKLKVDYCVREASHDFLTDFVNHLLSESKIDFAGTNKYYKNEYQHDETIKNLIANHKVIEEFVENKLISNKENLDDRKKKVESFLNYVENFIELNYFDTHLSEQGEQLYIYMNSRGENLSYHEIIKSEIVNKISNDDNFDQANLKKEAGKRWEEWQNFFWQYKGKNENADIGFQEFLKWAAIIEICSIYNPDIDKLKVIEKGKERSQSIIEAKENYIHRVEDRIKDQIIILEEYQKKSKNFTSQFLHSVFDALKFIIELNDKYVPFDKKWLSNELNTIDYVLICPLLYYLVNYKKQNQEIILADIRRLAMFLKNLTYFESSLGRNPDRATVLAMELVKHLVDNDQLDITFFLDPSFSRYNTLLTEFEIYKLRLYVTDNSPRKELEEFIWDLTLNEELSKFSEGNLKILFLCYDTEYNRQFIETYDINAIDELKLLTGCFQKSILKYRNDDLLRRTLLTFGNGENYLFWDKEGYGYAYSNEYIKRYSFLSSDFEWRQLLNNHQKKGELVIEMLIDFKKSSDLNDFHKYAKNRIESYNISDWKKSFIKVPQVLRYCGDKRVLWQNNNRIILLKKYMASASHGEIQTLLLKELIIDSWIYDEEKPFLCVYDFKLENNTIIANKEKKDSFALDIWWKKTGEWKFQLMHRTNDLVLLRKFQNEPSWKKIDEKYSKIDENFHSDDPSKSIMDNVEDAKSAFDCLIVEIQNIINNN